MFCSREKHVLSESQQGNNVVLTSIANGKASKLACGSVLICAALDQGRQQAMPV